MVKYKTDVVEDGREYDVWLAGKEEMGSLGKKWMKDEVFHEVISWPLEEKGLGPDGVWRLGDVVVYKDAKNRDFLIEHGVRHLLGQHHE
ncbi:hypothetical protein A3D85_02870 [Candidatus Amesbacteria bacterium RIFCSPHIGHO2_02_FULL_47_9]|uniref:rRNA maturation RNase YbeY n=1 Tax=Candidatus Amesbacteria bacterium RIFCSPHIGHO2_01_FULL_48_32b TaxID=1797253 RepID=A0A1F4YH46_9BACT|nr:MAG: hypothetical protein A2876_04860 [Candidatus Amesbacteria bacterium RIFCSPHIGHO2_01_FULL_48_32b]OGD03562.1 MAG: hypothetical protein A3D85_02870 [Candidatus Amesbacteria bacterium RIFCSPHIGHO2_02_FULL_47_9]OGD07026.1 MAG: hypothetical protein A2899_00115 [Candidatus Amesbacteria bacterium RIFCSPLOWO2_01_FULL_49_25]